MRFSLPAACVTAVVALAPAQGATAKTLEIYFIDVEGGQSTLLITPEKESFLIDTGWPGNGTPGSRHGDPSQARDAKRIVAAARDAGIKQIDYLLITHFHTDHDGGVVELAQLMPVRHFVDHGSLPEEAKQDAATKDAFEAYLAIRAKAKHIEPRPGDRLALKGIDATIVSSAALTIKQPLAGGGEVNAACSHSAPAAGERLENPRSTGVVVTFGKFRFLDVGDLTGQPLFDLACPKSLIGPVDAYLVAHHGGADASDPATFAAFKPRVAIMNNGLKKGGAQVTYESLHHVSGLEDVWQLHRSEAAGDSNFPTERIANIDESTAHWIKLTANEDGSFRVLNGRTNQSKTYPAR
ncbi:MAG: ComEC/Rec2 family competence protein [Steroidobacteraceae bacterium]